MLAGEPPYTGPTAQAILAKRLTEPVPHLRTVREVPLAARAGGDQGAGPVAGRSVLDGRRVRRGALQPDRSQDDAPRPASHAGPRRRRAGRLPGRRRGVTLLLALGAYAVFRRASPAGAAPARVRRGPALRGPEPQKDQEYFSDGLTEELITALSQVPGLRVAARTSSFQFKGRSPDVREVGRKLDVAAVLEGSVRKSGQPAPGQRPAHQREGRLSALVRVVRP